MVKEVAMFTEDPPLSAAQIAEIRAASASRIMGLRWPVGEEHYGASEDVVDGNPVSP